MNDTQNSFIQQWSPYAIQAGSVSGVDPNLILSQWALESNWGQSGSGNNVAGIGGGSNLTSFNSPQDFTDAYTSLLSNNYTSALGAGNDLTAFVQGLHYGQNGGTYYGSQSPDSYQSALEPVYSQISDANAAGPNIDVGQNSNVQPGWYLGPHGFQYGTGNKNDPTTTPDGKININSKIGESWDAVKGFVLQGGIGVLAIIIIAVGLIALAMKTEISQPIKAIAK